MRTGKSEGCKRRRPEGIIQKAYVKSKGAALKCAAPFDLRAMGALWRNKVTGEGEKGIIALLNDVIGNLLWNLQ